MSETVMESIHLTKGRSPQDIAALCSGVQPNAAQAALVHCEAMQVRKWHLAHGGTVGALLGLMAHWDGTALRQEALTAAGLGGAHMALSQGGASPASGQGGASPASGQGGASTASGQGGPSTALGQGGATPASAKGRACRDSPAQAGPPHEAGVVYHSAKAVLQASVKRYGTLHAVPRRQASFPLSVLQDEGLVRALRRLPVAGSPSMASGQGNPHIASGQGSPALIAASQDSPALGASASSQGSPAHTAFGQVMRISEQDPYLAEVFSWLPRLQERFGLAVGFLVVGEALRVSGEQAQTLRKNPPRVAARAALAWGASMLSLDEAGKDDWQDVFVKSVDWLEARQLLHIMMMRTGQQHGLRPGQEYDTLHHNAHMTL